MGAEDFFSLVDFLPGAAWAGAFLGRFAILLPVLIGPGLGVWIYQRLRNAALSREHETYMATYGWYRRGYKAWSARTREREATAYWEAAGPEWSDDD
jgi:hypothetical protein